MNTSRLPLRTGLAAAVAALVLSACGGGGDGPTPAQGMAAVFLRDAPITTSDGRPADAVNVEILEIELEQTDGGEITVFKAAPGSGISGNILDLTAPLFLTTALVPVGSYGEINLVINTANATIHFTDNNETAALLVDKEGEDNGELEFEFEPPLTVETSGVSNAVVDFAPVVSRNSEGRYVLDHDHENDQTDEMGHVGEDDGVDNDGDNDDGDVDTDAEVEGTYVRASGDVLTLSVHGSEVQVDVSKATSFQIDGHGVAKDVFLASLAAGEEVEAEGVFADGVLMATKAEAGD